MKCDAIGAHSTVREIVDFVPNGGRIFSILGLNYCCAYERSLADAARQAGVQAGEVLDLLSGTQAPMAENRTTDWNKANLTNLVDYIVEYHHRRARRDLIHLILMATEVASAHASQHPESWQLQDELENLSRDLIPHMQKEEMILFPFIEQMDAAVSDGKPSPVPVFGTVQNPVRMMMMEHDTAGDLLRDLRIVTKDYKVPADACMSFQALYRALEDFEKDLHQHIHLENNLLFPKATEIEEG